MNLTAEMIIETGLNPLIEKHFDLEPVMVKVEGLFLIMENDAISFEDFVSVKVAHPIVAQAMKAAGKETITIKDGEIQL